MLPAYNSIVAKLNERSSNRFEQSFKTRYGIVVNLRDFASRMDSVLYKRWAAKSLEYWKSMENTPSLFMPAYAA